MFKTIANAFRDKDIRRKIFLTLGVILIYRIGCYIPIPGLDIAQVSAAIGGNGFLEIMSTINGGALSNGTLFALGIIPFINSFIIMQLLTLIIPPLEKLSKEGDEGRKKITQITRYIAIGLAVVQGIGVVVALDKAIMPTFNSVFLTKCFVIILLTAGSTFVMWLGERITEYGIGNGTSLIIFIGILSSAGTALISAFTMAWANKVLFWNLAGILVLVILLFTLIVFVDASERRVSVKYAKQVKGNKMYGGQTTHIPMKINSSGVMPIIFASAFLMFPYMIASFWPNSGFFGFYQKWFATGTPIYTIFMLIFIVFFAYFYAQIQFNPVDISKNIQQYGGFIPGIRPGVPTAKHLKTINNRITLFGAMFLAFVALIPTVLFKLLDNNNTLNMTNAFSATGLLIVVSVALEFNKQLEAQILSKQYKGFLK